LYEISPKIQPHIRIEISADGGGQLLQSSDFTRPIAYVVSTKKVA